MREIDVRLGRERRIALVGGVIPWVGVGVAVNVSDPART
ncbi:Uncharacterised protein [Mycobacteroides abscessus subsp. abscessus]|nr:Uncharacterised protein [Mycobacteroides abscessus subsp. abscessus]